MFRRQDRREIEWHQGARIDDFGSLRGTLSTGPEAVLRAFRLNDELGQLAHKVWYFASLHYDEDQRDNTANARRQQAQLLMARASQASSWFNPELLRLPIEIIRGWIEASPDLQPYHFAIEDLYRQQEHVLDENGERLMSLASRLSSAPSDAYWSLSTADATFPSITLSTGEAVTVSYGQYRRILATERNQEDRRHAFRALHETYRANLNTYATLYNGICQKDWFHARARGYPTTLDAALHGDSIPTAVVETLIATTRAGADPLRRYHRLRRRALGLSSYHVYDFSIPLVEFDRRYPYPRVLDWIVDSLAPVGGDYQARVRQALAGGWIVDRTEGGLSRFGGAVVDECNRVGLVLDCTHLGHRSSLEIIDRSKAPVIFSHSNPRVLADNPRNISDEQITACISRGGIIGCVAWGPLVMRKGTTHWPTVDEFIACIDHVAQLAGNADHMGIGTDMSLGSYPPHETDPWGEPYKYLSPGSAARVDVFSLGRDNTNGGEGPDADIGSWAL